MFQRGRGNELNST